MAELPGPSRESIIKGILNTSHADLERMRLKAEQNQKDWGQVIRDRFGLTITSLKAQGVEFLDNYPITDRYIDKEVKGSKQNLSQILYFRVEEKSLSLRWHTASTQMPGEEAKRSSDEPEEEKLENWVTYEHEIEHLIQMTTEISEERELRFRVNDEYFRSH